MPWMSQLKLYVNGMCCTLCRLQRLRRFLVLLKSHRTRVRVGAPRSIVHRAVARSIFGTKVNSRLTEQLHGPDIPELTRVHQGRSGVLVATFLISASAYEAFDDVRVVLCDRTHEWCQACLVLRFNFCAGVDERGDAVAHWRFAALGPRGTQVVHRIRARGIASRAQRAVPSKAPDRFGGQASGCGNEEGLAGSAVGGVGTVERRIVGCNLPPARIRYVHGRP